MEVSEKIKQIKYSRLKKHEKWFINLIDNSIKVIYDDRPEIIIWKYEDFIIFKYSINDKYLHVNTTFYNYLYDYLKTNTEVKEYIKDTVKNYLGINIEKVFSSNLDIIF